MNFGLDNVAIKNTMADFRLPEKIIPVIDAFNLPIRVRS